MKAGTKHLEIDAQALAHIAQRRRYFEYVADCELRRRRLRKVGMSVDVLPFEAWVESTIGESA
jgi:hypothetical protein